MTPANAYLLSHSSIFVGREMEMALLRAALEDACTGQGGVVLLAGEPGIGKTRTAEELGLQAVQRGAQVLWGRCYEGSGAPAFWPWVQIIRAYVRTRDSPTLSTELPVGAADLARLVPEISERLPQLTAALPDDEQSALLAVRRCDYVPGTRCADTVVVKIVAA